MHRSSWIVGALVACLLTIHAAILFVSVHKNFATVDEVGHLAAGVYHWQTGEFAMYQVNPPLPRMLAVLPMLAARPDTSGIEPRDMAGFKNEWPCGTKLALDNRERYVQLVCLARLAGICWSLCGGLMVFVWARELYGNSAGCLALAVWCFEPNILANAQIVTPDVPATVAGLTATYFFWRYLRQPSWPRAVIAGLLLGVAELTKFTLLCLYVIWPLLWFLQQIKSDSGKHLIENLRHQRWKLGSIILISVLVINLGYGFKGTFGQLRDLRFVSRALAGNPVEGAPAFEHGLSGNRFRSSWLGYLPLPIPRDLLIGLDLQKRDFEYGMPSYLRGQWRNHGWWYYYIYALSLKVPVGLWILLAWSIAFRLWVGPQGNHRGELFLWFPAVFVLVLVSAQTGFNHHMRYVLPCLAFVMIPIGKLAYFLSLARWKAGVLILSLLGWSIGSSVAIHPHYLSYFNEVAGGPDNGHDHLIDSNIDWGQDLLYLKDWLERHPEARPLGLAYCNLIDPRIVGIDFCLPPPGPTGLFPDDNAYGQSLGPHPGYFAISVNYVRGSELVPPPDGKGGKAWPPPNYGYFQYSQPIAKAGYSIFIYHIDLEQANGVRAKLGLPLLQEDSSGTGVTP